MSVPPRLRPSSIEALEARIAPALLTYGANLLGGGGNPSTGETSVGGNAVTVVKVLGGQAIVWFDGIDVVGISFGPNTTLDITGNVMGDIVGNLTSEGRLSDSDNDFSNGEDGAVLLANNLTGLTVRPLNPDKGDVGFVSVDDSFKVGFSIVTGGSVSNVNIANALGGIYAGDGVFHLDSRLSGGGTATAFVGGDIDTNPIEPGTQSVFTLAKADAQMAAGASIRNVTMGKALGLQLISGNGSPTGAAATGAGPAGGDIENIRIDTAETSTGAPLNTLSYQMIAGDGANGASGGAGGSVNKIIERSSSGIVEIRAGKGGAGSAGAGGSGGSVLNVDVQSNSTGYTVTAGDGGQGTPGGAGGDVQRANFANRTSNSGLVFTADFTGDGIMDVAIVDGSTGRIAIAVQDNAGLFDLALQYVDLSDPMNPQPVFVVDSQGSLPRDGAVADFDGNGALDLVIAYGGSNSLVVLLNQTDNMGVATGSFYSFDAMNVQFDLQAVRAGLVGSPNAIDVNPDDPSRIAVAGAGEENNREIGVLELFERVVDGGTGALSLQRIGTETKAAVAFTDVALPRAFSGFTGAIAGLRNGSLMVGTLAQQPADGAAPALNFSSPFATVSGGVRQFDVSSVGTTLAVLGNSLNEVLIFDVSSPDPVQGTSLTLDGNPRPSIARFVDDPNTIGFDDLAVLYTGAASSRIQLFAPSVDAFVADRGFDSASVLRNFDAFNTGTQTGFAGITGALNAFTFSPDFASSSSQALPFSGKIVEVTAGHGGAGVDLPNKVGKGGAGGSINGFNAEAFQIIATAGNGGNTQKGAGGAGGSIVNPPSFVAAGGGTVVPKLIAEDAIGLIAGAGGSPSTVQTVATAAGGAGGSMKGLNIQLLSGAITLTGGAGGSSRGGNAGAGGGLQQITTTAFDGSLAAMAGAGGAALGDTGNGGAGGAISGFNHMLTLAAQVEELHKAYSVSLSGGAGGASMQGKGGAGGALKNVSLDLDNSDIEIDPDAPTLDDGLDNTVTIALSTGAGGDGATGGAGGDITGLRYKSLHDQTFQGGIILGYFVMDITCGAGGNGTSGAGGKGGSYLNNQPISGITGFDPNSPDFGDTPLVVTAGTGGDGVTAGGAGGSINKLTARNALFFNGNVISTTHLGGARLTAGAGGSASAGNGGVGGSITGSVVGAGGASLLIYGSFLQDFTDYAPLFAAGEAGVEVTAIAGAGGNGAGTTKARGGAGGSITGGEYGLAVGFEVGGPRINFALTAGAGGSGAAAGGAGGVLGNLKVSINQDSAADIDTNAGLDPFIGGEAVLTAGTGGAATGSGGKGGKGGDINGISQLKDLNSVISAIVAGNGGNAAQGIGGTGGSVLNVKSAGFIGRPVDLGGPLGINNPAGFAQGIFVGLGGDGAGASDGLNGSVVNVTARQIAAIAAVSATPGLFAAAEKVSNVKADLIGYDIDGDGVCDDVMNAAIKPATPATVMAADGFIFAKTIANVIVNGGAPNAAFVFDV